MSDDIRNLMSRWQDAMRRRDRLQDAREKLDTVRADGVTLEANTLADIEAALDRANKEVEELQAAVLGAAGGDQR